MKTKYKRIAITLGVAICSSIILNGCASYINAGCRINILGGTGSSSCDGFTDTSFKTVQGELLFSDKLLALSIPSEAQLAVWQTQGLQSQHFKEKPMLLLGQSHSYLLDKGGDALFRLAQGFKKNANLDPKSLRIMSNESRVIAKDNMLHGEMVFEYKIKNQEEARTIIDLGFTPAQNNRYVINIEVLALLIPAVDTSAYVADGFAQQRSLNVYAPDSQKTYETPRWGNIALAPFALAVDIALSPIFLLGAAGIVLSN
ncbi:hypothetical protein [Hydromonas duriensis]|uniref:Uncharacterized protein n=1 Tax=Hydromonas duriensis TaxID=1527608 RepID=A0A4R6Y9V7_9BURK|nr:hypothetical protein [Hydromonas duriensis]TDR32302.1 hypothetical protein DFR44_10416 [Hydromonas duriensis]